MIKYITYPQGCVITALGGEFITIMTRTQAQRYIRRLMKSK